MTSRVDPSSSAISWCVVSTVSSADCCSSQAISKQFRSVSPDEAFTCALLGGIGQLALASVYPVKYGQMLDQWIENPETELKDLENEILYRFEFPERPGALLDFLNAIGTDWNISLFHYRNHGSDYGRILAGIDVAEDETAELEAHLAELGYPHWEESDNPAYAIFLS